MSNLLIFILIIAIVIIKYVKSNVSLKDESNLPDENPSPSVEQKTYWNPEPVTQEPAPEPVIQEVNPATISPEKAAEEPGSPLEPDSLYGLIGKPLGHSFSRQNFKKKFKNEGIDADYRNYELDSASEITDLVRNNPTIKGLNVTIPYKQDVMEFLDYVDPTAQAIGAVNVVKVIRNSEDGSVRLEGYNTDVIGFWESLKPMLPEEPVKALILGTGGASKAIRHALDTHGIEYRFVSRNPGFDNMGYYELSPSVMEEHRLIINCTPVGMYPKVDDCPGIPYSYLDSSHILFDVVYNPLETLFMKKGTEAGAATKNGLEMLKIQAEEAWKIWNT